MHGGVCSTIETFCHMMVMADLAHRTEITLSHPCCSQSMKSRRRAAPHTPRAEEQALAEGILIHFVALLRHAKNDTFIIIHFLLDASHRNGDVMIAACYYSGIGFVTFPYKYSTVIELSLVQIRKNHDYPPFHPKLRSN